MNRFEENMMKLFRCIPFRRVNRRMTHEQNVDDLSTKLSYLSVSTKSDIKYRPMPDPLSVYVPLNSLTEETIHSIVSTVQRSTGKHWNHGRRTLLAFLLAINNRLNEIENEKEDVDKKFDEQTIQHAAKVRQWLVEKDSSTNIKELDWTELQERYQKMLNETDHEMAHHFGVEKYEPYFELTIEGLHPDVIQSRKYMARFRSHGWDPKELKVYWNFQQLEDLCSKSDTENPPAHDPSDADAVLALRQYPVVKRSFDCKIEYINKGIELAVFDAPEDVQLIVLNFANERSPGGGYLRHAWAQEEIILFNSDGYRSLLDLKYGRMGGGYAIPEFGLAYVRDISFVDKETSKIRKADMLVSACYCLVASPQLYANPGSTAQLIENDIAKFRAFISAAVANTKGDGSNTYLLLGPIGTGAFGNDVDQIGKVFHQVLSSEMMGSSGPIRDVFPHIWFVSTDKWKNDRFQEIFEGATENIPSDVN